MQFSKCPVNKTKPCLDTPKQKMYATVIHREPLADWIERWNHLKLIVDWQPLGVNSKVTIFKNHEKVKHWEGLLGRNDRNGCYMKYGVYSSRKYEDFKLMVADAYSDIDN